MIRQRYERDKNDTGNEAQQEEQPRKDLQRFKVTASYDGTDFHGSQIQQQGGDAAAAVSEQAKEKDTVQGRIEHRLASFLKQPDFAIAMAGRTDAGVHALGQVFHFDAPLQAQGMAINEQVIMNVLRTLADGQIQITAVEKVPSTFHARLSCLGKRYEYKIYDGGVPSPFETRWCHSVPQKRLDVDKMREAAALFVGEKVNMTNFGLIEGGDPRDVRKNISLLEVARKSEHHVVVAIEADRYLRSMARMVSGTLIDVGLGKRTIDDIKMLLAPEEHSRAELHHKQGGSVRVQTAPAKGLCLVKCFF